MFHHSPHSRKATGDKEIEKFLKRYIKNLVIIDNQVLDEFGTIIGNIDILPRETILYHKTLDKFLYSICKDGWRKGVTFFCKNKKLCDQAYVGVSGKKSKRVSFLKNIIKDDLILIDFKSDYHKSDPFEIEGISDNRSFFLPKQIQRMVQAYDYSNFTPRQGKYNKKWEMFRNYEMFYRKICKKLKLDGWSAVVLSDQPSRKNLKEYAILDANDKMNIFKCDINGNKCIKCSEYVTLFKLTKKKRKEKSSRSSSRRKKYIAKKKDHQYSYRLFHQNRKIQ